MKKRLPCKRFLDGYQKVCSKTSHFIKNDINYGIFSGIWFDNIHAGVYLRKLENNIEPHTIVIANIYIHKKYRQRGFGTQLIEMIHNLESKYERTYLECVRNRHLERWCVRNGWIKDEQYDTCYYKLKVNHDNV